MLGSPGDSSSQTPAVFTFASLETTVTFRIRKKPQNGLSQNTAEVCNFELALWKQELRSLRALIIDTHTMSKWGASEEVTVIPNSHFCVYDTKAIMLMMGTRARGEQEAGIVYRSSEMWFSFMGYHHSKQFFNQT